MADIFDKEYPRDEETGLLILNELEDEECEEELEEGIADTMTLDTVDTYNDLYSSFADDDINYIVTDIDEEDIQDSMDIFDNIAEEVYDEDELELYDDAYFECTNVGNVGTFKKGSIDQFKQDQSLELIDVDDIDENDLFEELILCDDDQCEEGCYKKDKIEEIARKASDKVYDWYKEYAPEDYQLDNIDKDVTFKDVYDAYKADKDVENIIVDFNKQDAWLDSAPVETIINHAIDLYESKLTEEVEMDVKDQITLKSFYPVISGQLKVKILGSVGDQAFGYSGGLIKDIPDIWDNAVVKSFSLSDDGSEITFNVEAPQEVIDVNNNVQLTEAVNNEEKVEEDLDITSAIIDSRNNIVNIMTSSLEPQTKLDDMLVELVLIQPEQVSIELTTIANDMRDEFAEGNQDFVISEEQLKAIYDNIISVLQPYVDKYYEQSGLEKPKEEIEVETEETVEEKPVEEVAEEETETEEIEEK